MNLEWVVLVQQLILELFVIHGILKECVLVLQVVVLLLLLLESPLQAAEFLIIILAVQQIDGNFIAPRILGGATGLSGLGVLLAIVVGGELFGIPGMVAGVPTLAVLAALARQAVGAGLTARGLPEEPPPAPQGKTVTKKAKN